MRFQLISLDWTFIRVPCFGIRSLTHPGDPWETFKVRAYFAIFALFLQSFLLKGCVHPKYGKYARTLKVSRRSPGWVMDLIPKHGILLKVQLRDFSWNLAPPTPAGPPRGSSVGVYLSSYYKTENDGILRIELYCQKLQNSLNLMIILKNWMSHWEYLKSAVKDGRFLDRGSLAGVWSNHVWRDFPEIVLQLHY